MLAELYLRIAVLDGSENVDTYVRVRTCTYEGVHEEIFERKKDQAAVSEIGC